MLTDIKIANGDIVFGTDDLELVHDNDCIQQHITTLLSSSPNTWFYDSLVGSRLLSFIQSPRDHSTKRSIEQEVKMLLSSDPNIITNSISINIEEVQDLTLSISFYTTLSNDIVNLTYVQDTKL